MNILFIALDFKPKIGGGGEYAYQLVKHLHSFGENMMVLCQTTEGDEEFDQNIPFKVKRFNYIYKNKILGQYKIFKEIRDAIKEHQAELIISNNLNSEGHLSWLLSRMFRIPHYIFTYAYGWEIDRRIRKKTPKGILRALIQILKSNIAIKKSDKVYCLGPAVRELIIKKTGIPYSKIELSPPGISDEFLKRANEKISDFPSPDLKKRLKDKRIIFTLARLVERKGIDMILQALPKVKEKFSNVFYIIGGDGPYREYLEELMRNLNLKNDVLFTGFISEEEKHFYYSRAEIFVMPNRELPGELEGFGIVFLEANAYRKPVIAGNSGGAVDAVLNGKTGLLVNPFDAVEIANAIIYLLENKEYAQKLGQQGRKRVENEFRWKIIVKKLRENLRD